MRQREVLRAWRQESLRMRSGWPADSTDKRALVVVVDRCVVFFFCTSQPPGLPPLIRTRRRRPRTWSSVPGAHRLASSHVHTGGACPATGHGPSALPASDACLLYRLNPVIPWRQTPKLLNESKEILVDVLSLGGDDPSETTTVDRQWVARLLVRSVGCMSFRTDCLEVRGRGRRMRRCDVREGGRPGGARFPANGVVGWCSGYVLRKGRKRKERWVTER